MRHACLALSCALLMPGATAARAQQPAADTAAAAVNRIFAPWSGSDTPGCAVGVARNGTTVLERGFGMANLEVDAPITPASIFHVASVSKQFTAAAIMLLAREGRLSLDDDIRTYLPEIPDYGHRITIRNLLTHTSGLRDQWDLLFMARGRFEESRITEADVLEIVPRQRALNFVPGTEYLYSNTGYTLAAVIVRRVSGMSLRDFAAERIFRPLGMTSTHFQDDYTRVVKGRTSAYARRADGAWRVSIPNYDTYGATSLFTTVGDLLRWQANFDSAVALDAAALEAMQAPGMLSTGDTSAYGLGLVTEIWRGARLVGHGGADAGYRTYLGRLPEHGLAVAVLCNAAPANPSALARSVAAAYLGGALAAEPAPEPPRASLDLERLRRLAGVYVHPVTGAPTFVTLRGETLVVGRTTGPALVPLSETRFRVTGAPVELEFTPTSELVQTVLAWPGGTPTRLRRATPATPTAAELARYAGTYHSEELGATYTVAATDSTLELRTRGGTTSVVRPAYGDTFAGDLLISFVRDRAGRVRGMTMGSGRVRGVRFQRVEASSRG